MLKAPERVENRLIMIRRNFAAMRASCCEITTNDLDFEFLVVGMPSITCHAYG